MDPIIEKLTTARVGLLLKQPFFGNMATRMPLIDASSWCPTAATNGKNFYYNREFVDSLNTSKLEFLFAHEICHAIFDHISRVGSRDHQLSNIAQDYAINQILIDDRIGERITEVDICYDSKYRGMAWEEIYDELYEQAEKIPMEDLLDQLGDLLDEHLKEDSIDSADENDNNKPTISKEEAKKIREELKEAMIQSASAAGAGNIPGQIQRVISNMTEPKMDWREILRMNIQSIVRNDYSFARPNRKSAHSGAILPGMLNDETIDVAVAIDMSASISDQDAAVFLTEIKGIMDQYEDYSVKIWCFDTEVYAYAEFTQNDADDILNYQPMGGGGTDFMANWTFMKDNNIEPKKFIMFTDGMPWNSWGEEDYCDTLFIIKGSREIEAPFGQTVSYERDIG